MSPIRGRNTLHLPDGNGTIYRRFHVIPTIMTATTIILKTLQLSYPCAILIMALLYCRKPIFLPMKYYMSMTFRPEARRLFARVLARMVLLYNFSFTRTEPLSLWQLPGLLYGLLLLHGKFTSATLSWLHSDRMLQGFAFALIMFSMMSEELFPLSVSFAMTFAAALIYPSRKLLRMAERPGDYPEFIGTENDIRQHY